MKARYRNSIALCLGMLIGHLSIPEGVSPHHNTESPQVSTLVNPPLQDYQPGPVVLNEEMQITFESDQIVIPIQSVDKITADLLNTQEMELTDIFFELTGFPRDILAAQLKRLKMLRTRLQLHYLESSSAVEVTDATYNFTFPAYPDCAVEFMSIKSEILEKLPIPLSSRIIAELTTRKSRGQDYPLSAVTGGFGERPIQLSATTRGEGFGVTIRDGEAPPINYLAVRLGTNRYHFDLFASAIDKKRLETIPSKP